MCVTWCDRKTKQIFSHMSSARKKVATASAPGKLILFGEHVCVYGYTAVAAALSDLRIFVEASLEEDRAEPEIEATLLDLPSATGSGAPTSCRVSLHSLCVALAVCHDVVSPWWQPSPPSDAHVQALASTLQHLPSQDQAALAPLLYLCASMLPQLLAHPIRTGVCVRVRSSDLPVGAGLGSSAAFSVSLAAAFMRLQLDWMAPLRDEPGSRAALRSSTAVRDPPAKLRDGLLPAAATRELINGWAYAAECMLHGRPSGLDNAVSCAGEAMKLTQAAREAPLRFEQLPGFPRLRVLLTNTNVPRRTADLVKRVRGLYESPETAEPTRKVFEAVARTTEQFLAIASAAGTIGGARDVAASASARTMQAIGALIRMNHGLLNALQVSAPALEHVCGIALAEGLPTKLTGAGGGGCAYSLLGGGEGGTARDSQAPLRAQRRLEAAGYTCYVTHVGGHGVLWHSAEALPEMTAACAPRGRRAIVVATTAAAALLTALIALRTRRPK